MEFRGCRKSIFNQSKRGGLGFFFEIRFSHTPPNKQISSLKIFHQTTDQIKIHPFIVKVEFVTVPLISMPLKIFSTEMKFR